MNGETGGVTADQDGVSVTQKSRSAAPDAFAAAFFTWGAAFFAAFACAGLSAAGVALTMSLSEARETELLICSQSTSLAWCRVYCHLSAVGAHSRGPHVWGSRAEDVLQGPRVGNLQATELLTNFSESARSATSNQELQRRLNYGAAAHRGGGAVLGYHCQLLRRCVPTAAHTKDAAPRSRRAQ